MKEFGEKDGEDNDKKNYNWGAHQAIIPRVLLGWGGLPKAFWDEFVPKISLWDKS